MTSAKAITTTTSLGGKELPALEVQYTITDRQLINSTVEDVVKSMVRDATWRLSSRKGSLLLREIHDDRG